MVLKTDVPDHLCVVTTIETTHNTELGHPGQSMLHCIQGLAAMMVAHISKPVYIPNNRIT